MDNRLKGGDADGWTPEKIAAKHKVSLEHINTQIRMGMEEELEHTEDLGLRIEIAMDHLVKNPNYYFDLKSVEKPEAVVEDGEGAPATPDSVPGMGAPVLAQRGSVGSGDVPLGITKPKKKNRVQMYDEFLKKLKKGE